MSTSSRQLVIVALAVASLALSPVEQASLKTAVDALKAQGVVSTPDILERLVERPVIGRKTNLVVRAKPSIEWLQAQYQPLAAKYGLATTNSAAEVEQQLKAASDAAQASADPVGLTTLKSDTAMILMLQQELAPGAARATTNTVVEPVLGDPLWTGPAITGEDVEAVQRR